MDFAQLLSQSCQFDYTEHKQHISIENGTLVLSNKSPKGKTIDYIDLWTEAFSNFSKILIKKHTNLASDLFYYMSIIRSAITDAKFDRIYQYDKQFRLRVSQDHTKSWAQIDGFIWLQFIAIINHKLNHRNLWKGCPRSRAVRTWHLSKTLF